MPEGDFLAFQKDGVAPRRKLTFYYLTSQPTGLRYMKEKSVEVPALKDLRDRPLDLGFLGMVELGCGYGTPLTDAFRSLKPHGSDPERVLDLLCFLFESSDEKTRKMDLDDVSVEHVTAGRSALGKVIELARKNRKKTWNCYQVAPWLRYLSLKNSWCLGSMDLSRLRALDGRASILMTRLKQETKKENDACSQEVA